MKAYYVEKKEEHPPFVHNLLRLALRAEISVDEDLKHRLVTISAFNINALYDDYKRSFQKTWTSKFTEDWIEVIKDLRIWILEQIKG
ncbi:HEPN domain-containing protein [Marinilabilia salmonicolor]|uniref:HEPN domain-containing protein n=1 Tax=Marinilabilia salmonicolor TaxID=989 RepID=UPI00029A9D62